MKYEYIRQLPKFYLFCERCEEELLLLMSSSHNYSIGKTINIYICQNCGFKKTIRRKTND